MSVTTPKGFRAAGVTAGLKESGTPDLALVVNDGPRSAVAGVFTTNRIQAAPVTWSREVVRGGSVRAVVLNSGGANACTGPDGFADTHRTAEATAAAVGVDPGEVAVCSTGLIGVRLPLDRVLDGVSKAAAGLSADGGRDAAEAIRTTDTVAKTSFLEHVDGWTVGAMGKGAAMLAPALATMLVVVTTDADVDAETCDRALRDATRVTFDRLDTDGCMSTNDTVLLLASGASGAAPAYDEFAAAVRGVCADLAAQMADDAEGASKRLLIEVVGAATEDDAVTVGRAVGRSNLFKCAVHGEDPNWGRALSAVGTTDAAFEPDGVDIAINGVFVCRGSATGEDRALVDMSARDVHVVVDLHAGDATATVVTTDLTADYVHENSAYST
ncbi:MAG TPA: bifunctional glutamate N-acetyltransferase/amino-acid acetyltransferase ArgJ [Mycobacteriales bacterium]|nr:bifunctional glutamate N-acetyltransferase/amino-acid acetyltransferase ArgJ [Mycobacteriales bacterium]